jgi:hypothetical protein
MCSGSTNLRRSWEVAELLVSTRSPGSALTERTYNATGDGSVGFVTNGLREVVRTVCVVSRGGDVRFKPVDPANESGDNDTT